MANFASLFLPSSSIIPQILVRRAWHNARTPLYPFVIKSIATLREKRVHWDDERKKRDAMGTFVLYRSPWWHCAFLAPLEWRSDLQSVRTGRPVHMRYLSFTWNKQVQQRRNGTINPCLGDEALL
jgi:hypothetical protein